LKWLMLDAPEQREKAYEELCRGWYVGTEEGKSRIAGKVQNGEARANAELQKELSESRWRALLKMGLDALGKKPEDLKCDLKSADWKVALGAWIKSQSGATNRWLGENLQMGHFYNVSKRIRNHERDGIKKCRYSRRLSQLHPNA